MLTRSEAQARTVLEAAGGRYKFPTEGAVLLAGRTSTSFALPGLPLVAKVAPPDSTLVRLALEVGFARKMQERGAPVAPPAGAYGAQPLGDAGGLVTLWRWIDHDTVNVLDFEKFGAALRKFQEVGEEVFEVLPVGRLNALGEAGKWIGKASEAGRVPPEVLGLLSHRHRELMTGVSGAGSLLGYGVIHGDVTLDNVVAGEDGPVLLDMDTVCVGPREWDLVQIAGEASAGRLSLDRYRAFTRGYGYDVQNWEGYLPMLRTLCLARTSWLLRWAVTELAAYHELAAWLQWWAGDASAETTPGPVLPVLPAASTP